MLRTISLVALLTATAALHASEPMSFDFVATGSPALRPVLVFHDGKNTYLQPPDGAKGLVVEGAKADRYGPYLLIAGIPDSFTIKSGGQFVVIKNTKRQATPATNIPAQTLASAQAPALALPQPQTAPKTAIQASPYRAFQAAVAAEPTQMDCIPKILRAKSGFVIGFSHGAVTLGKYLQEKIKQSVGNVGDIEEISLEVEAPNDSEIKATGRAKALTAYLTSLGVPAGKIHSRQRNRTGLGTEMQITRTKLEPCAEIIKSRESVTANKRGASSTVVTGEFKVTRTQDETSYAMPAKQDQLVLRIDEALAVDRRAELSMMASNGVSVVVADGSQVGIQRAREVSDHIERVKGARPRMENNGAPTGFVVVKGHQ